MDREIKFRGKDRISNKWVYGYYVKRWVSHFIEFPESDFKWKQVDVKRETVGQYIGRKDKNEKYIYKDDIVKRYNGEIGVVVFDEGCFILKRVNEGNCEYIQHCSEYFNECEIIGNVFENSSLLEENIQ